MFNFWRITTNVLVLVDVNRRVDVYTTNGKVSKLEKNIKIEIKRRDG